MSSAKKDIHEGDLTWLSMNPLKLEGNVKLLIMWVELFEVIECLYKAYHLCLPSTIQIHTVINLVFLKKFISPLDSDLQCKTKQVSIKEVDEKCDVEKILDHCKRGNKLEYYVLWLDSDKT